MVKLQKKDEKEIFKLRGLFPREISVLVHRSKDGGFWAEITAFSGCLTQADTFSELIEMVNDAVRTYLGVPLKYLPYMPTYLPLLEAAKQFDAFPTFTKDKDLKLTLPNRDRAFVSR